MRVFLTLFFLLSLPLPSFAQPPQLLFDQGHRQVFVINQAGPLHLGGLARVMDAEGWEIHINSGELTAEVLQQTDALIISGAFQPMTDSEVEAISGFLQKGGSLAVMLHIYQPFVKLLGQLGVEAGSQVIQEEQNRFDDKPSDFFVTDLKPHPLTKGLQQFALYGSWPLKSLNPSAKEIVHCSPQAWLDSNNDQQHSADDPASPFAVLISGEFGKGAFAVFADDAIFQNQFLSGGNLELAKNLAKWLKTGLGGKLEI